MSKQPLLFLCHRIPFPPNKGDKIRSFNVLKQLSENYDVHLGALVDDENDWQYESELQKYCKSLCLVPLNATKGKIRGLVGALSGTPISLPYFYSRKLSQWVQATVTCNSINKAFVFSSAMAQYVEDMDFQRRVADFVDVDSDKWRQYANKTHNPILKLVYYWESKTLAVYEKKITHSFDAVTFVSEDEARFFRQQLPGGDGGKVSAFPNGVNSDYFNPANIDASPESSEYIAFTGAMDYWANVDAVVWFAEKVWPTIVKQRPNLTFIIVGGNPTDKVKALAHKPGIKVTGRVDDVRPFIKHAMLSVAPLRIARGIQNKVLEAMAMRKVVILTSMAAEGIQLPEAQKAFIHDNAEPFAQACLAQLEDQENNAHVGQVNRNWIVEHYQWQAVTRCLNDYLG